MYKIGRIKSFGKVWEDKLKRYLNEGNHGLREVARFMECDPKTILRFDELLGINYFKEAGFITEHKEEVNDDNKLEEYKECILNNITNNPSATRTEIRNMCKKEYTYFYRKNNNWLNNNLPQQTMRIPCNNRVNWDKRDVEYLALIKAKYEELVTKDIPIRITKSTIGKSLGILACLEYNLSKLPKTDKYLKDILESVEEFQLRRCKKLIDNKIKATEEIKL